MFQFGKCKHTITKTGFLAGMEMAYVFQKRSPLKKMFDKTCVYLLFIVARLKGGHRISTHIVIHYGQIFLAVVLIWVDVVEIGCPEVNFRVSVA